MRKTPLLDKLVETGARTGEYCGVETASVFTGAGVEFATLLGGCAVYDLGWRAHFRISGRDRVRWLNGMVTNNIRDLTVGRGNYSFVLNAQGHILGDLCLYNRGDDFIAATDHGQLENLLKVLRKFIIMDQVEIEELAGEPTSIGVQGPLAAEVLDKAGFEGARPEAMELVDSVWHGQHVALTRRNGGRSPNYELWIPPAEAPGVFDSLLAAGAVPVGTEALEMFRVTAGIPRYGVDIRERDLPQETAQMQALSFVKGCYIGQEIVERIRARGKVHRTFTGFKVEGDLPAPGAKIQAEGKDVGEITSARKVPHGENDRILALGYARREFAKPDSLLQVNGAPAIPSELPFPELI